MAVKKDSTTKAAKKPDGASDNWLIETLDTRKKQWEPSNLNAINDTEWIREAKVKSNPEVLRQTNPFDWCVEVLQKSAKFDEEFNASEYRIRNQDNPDDFVMAAVFV